ncbi:MAG: fatty acid cis/trans isomerase [Bdellovibrionales bacterium]|nr:fatty acid cis/trans isomerase [Bdellovibrionales bacterium]
MKKIIALIIILIILIISFLLVIFKPFETNYMKKNAGDIIPVKDEFTTKIKPIFDSKCVACHSCYNSPCQLNLTSYEGLIRGAHKTDIYDFSKLKPRKPTRLYIDAHSKAQWQELGFYPVVEQKTESSLLSYYISKIPGIESKKQESYNSEEQRFCMNDINPIQEQGLKLTNSAARMPYGFPALNEKEISTINTWIKKGAPGPSLQKMESSILNHPELAPKINKLETLFNQKTLKAQIASRYLYEHLFLAHIYFQSAPNVFFRLVRSKTPTNKIEEIGTTYPFDDPQQKFYYRLRPVTNTITHKSHIPFMVSTDKLKRWKQEFYNTPWDNVPETMPAYDAKGSNPFETFKSIPTKTRYRFFLENTHYHIMTFIKGPVCRGQTALNVINDHFWVFFIDPEKDALSNSPELYQKVAKDMQMPAALDGNFDPFIDFRKKYWNAIELKFKSLEKQNDPINKDWFWYGDQQDTNALLTVYRHFDSAMVFKGLRGKMPKTIWLLDYHVFESIYYNLTAGYNVFGPLLHQLQSRLYMEISRIASEDLFISLLPKEKRAQVRTEWNTPVPDKNSTLLKRLSDLVSENVKQKMQFDYPYQGENLSTAFNFSQQDFKTQWFNSVVLKNYSIEQINSENDISPQTKASKEEFNSLGVKSGLHLKHHRLLSPLVALPSSVIQHLPDTLLLRNTDTQEAYTLIHNKSHYNVSMLFFENDRRQPDKDDLDILPGVATSYANLYLVLNDKSIMQLAQKLKNAKNKPEVNSILKEYALLRTSKNFWKHHRWFSEQSSRAETNESGWLDLNRYLNF